MKEEHNENGKVSVWICQGIWLVVFVLAFIACWVKAVF